MHKHSEKQIPQKKKLTSLHNTQPKLKMSIKIQPRKTNRTQPMTYIQCKDKVEAQQQSNIKVVRPQNTGTHHQYPRLVTIHSHKPWEPKNPTEPNQQLFISKMNTFFKAVS